MKPVSQTPTQPTDYAALSLTYGTLLAGLARSARGRDPIPPAELVPLSAASFALSKLIVREKVETWLRQPFVEEHADGKRPRGTRLRYAIGELLSCTRCVGAWSALGLVALRTHSPAAGRAVTTVLVTSAGNDFVHSAFSLLCARTNAAQAEQEQREAETREVSAPRRAA